MCRALPSVRVRVAAAAEVTDAGKGRGPRPRPSLGWSPRPGPSTPVLLRRPARPPSVPSRPAPRPGRRGKFTAWFGIAAQRIPAGAWQPTNWQPGTVVADFSQHAAASTDRYGWAIGEVGSAAAACPEPGSDAPEAFVATGPPSDVALAASGSDATVADTVPPPPPARERHAAFERCHGGVLGYPHSGARPCSRPRATCMRCGARDVHEKARVYRRCNGAATYAMEAQPSRLSVLCHAGAHC